MIDEAQVARMLASLASLAFVACSGGDEALPVDAPMTLDAALDGPPIDVAIDGASIDGASIDGASIDGAIDAPVDAAAVQGCIASPASLQVSEFETVMVGIT